MEQTVELRNNEIATTLKETVLMCSICLGPFQLPKVLQCLHSFCLKCLKCHYQATANGNNFVRCPLCRNESTRVPRGGIKELPEDKTIRQIIDLLKQNKPKQSETKTMEPAARPKRSAFANLTNKRQQKPAWRY